MTDTVHVSLDLETWGTRPGCDIRSIGAVVFDPVAGALPDWFHTGNTFYVATENPPADPDDTCFVGRGSSLKYSLTRDPETVQWWNDQSEEAQAAFANPVDLREACIQFDNWIADVTRFSRSCDVKQNENLRLWANGPQFDCSILEAVYHAVGLPVPWHYRAPRDFRTIVHDAAGMTRDDLKAFSTGIHHNALDDATSQARAICEAFKRINRNG